MKSTLQCLAPSKVTKNDGNDYHYHHHHYCYCYYWDVCAIYIYAIFLWVLLCTQIRVPLGVLNPKRGGRDTSSYSKDIMIPLKPRNPVPHSSLYPGCGTVRAVVGENKCTYGALSKSIHIWNKYQESWEPRFWQKDWSVESDWELLGIRIQLRLQGTAF